MRPFLLVFWFVSLLHLTPAHAKSGIYLEPYGGYGIENYKATVTLLGLTGSTNQDCKGLVYGAKLGIANRTFAVGGEYMRESVTFKNTSGSNSNQNIGAFVQIQLGEAFKLGGSYYPLASVSSSSSTATGNGFKGSIGYALFPKVYLNAEYLSLSFNKISSNSAATFSATLSGPILSLSLMFNEAYRRHSDDDDR